MKIINQTKQTILARDVIIADTVFNRMKGLLGKKDFKQDQALVLKPANSIHTFFMRFPIDVIFIDYNGKVIALRENLIPWRITPIYWKSAFVIELPAKVIIQTKTSVRDTINLST